jgi:NAD(P)-dependent dehydrogenase (short-subunit alcohol dehydrogenase family)
MAIKGYTTTTDGIEMQFGVNHIGHFLLTNLLMDKLFAAGKGARIINVSSGGYISGREPDD